MNKFQILRVNSDDGFICDQMTDNNWSLLGLVWCNLNH